MMTETTPSHEAARIPADMATDLAEQSRAYVSGYSEMTQAWLNFVQHRFQTASKQMQAVADCKDMATLIDLNTGYLRDMAKEYGENAMKFAEIGKKAFMPK
ncbi:MAG: phasin family protein [Sphingomonadales bacterium]|nr:MAG: phasin family protein [Sphingomonadales bacterium]